MGTETEHDDSPLVVVRGDRNATQLDIRVSHDLGDRTLVVVILLVIVIGACGVVMGRNLARQASLEDSALQLARDYAVHTNHIRNLEAQMENAK